MATLTKPPTAWADIPEAPADPIIGLNAMFLADPHADKLNLGVGAYRTDEGVPYVLPVVRAAELELASDPLANHEYLPIEGIPDFRKAAAQLILGPESTALAHGRVVTVQALSGTGALRVGCAYLKRFYRPGARVYIPDPTWANHRNIVPDAGLGTALTYRYYSNDLRGLDFDGMMADLEAADDGSIVVLHGCAHNPTGADPSDTQWNHLLQLCRRKNHLPFFDNAYQGFASGSLRQDSAAVRLFADSGMDMLISQSFAKNMGLYGERVGALSVVFAEPAMSKAILSQLKAIIRAMYSSPPAFGAKVAAKILNDPARFSAWENELRLMSGRILDMRKLLRDALIANETPGNWDHIVNQIGMFSYTGLTKEQVSLLREKHHVYMTSNGRVSMAGLTTATVTRFADAIKDAVLSVPAGSKL